MNQIFCLSHHFVFLYLKNASRHNVPKSKLGKQGSNLINTTNYITIRYEEPVFFFNSDHLGIGRCKWRSYTKYHFIKLFYFATWKPRIRTAYVRKSISLQRSESMDLDLLRLFYEARGIRRGLNWIPIWQSNGVYCQKIIFWYIYF